MIPTVPFKEAYFLEDALKFREALPGAPLIYVGGLVSREKIDEVLDAGFDPHPPSAAAVTSAMNPANTAFFIICFLLFAFIIPVSRIIRRTPLGPIPGCGFPTT